MALKKALADGSKTNIRTAKAVILDGKPKQNLRKIMLQEDVGGYFEKKSAEIKGPKPDSELAASFKQKDENVSLEFNPQEIDAWLLPYLVLDLEGEIIPLHDPSSATLALTSDGGDGYWLFGAENSDANVDLTRTVRAAFACSPKPDDFELLLETGDCSILTRDEVDNKKELAKKLSETQADPTSCLMDVTQAFRSELKDAPNLELYVVLRLLGHDTKKEDPNVATAVAIRPVAYWAHWKKEKKDTLYLKTLYELKRASSPSNGEGSPPPDQIEKAREILERLETNGLDQVLPDQKGVRVKVHFKPKRQATLLVVDSLTEQPSKQK